MADQLYQGMLVFDPVEGGALYAVAAIEKAGSKEKAVLVRFSGFTTKLTMKHRDLPEGWSILSSTDVADLIKDNPTRAGVT
jgi:hypothetical protein